MPEESQSDGAATAVAEAPKTGAGDLEGGTYEIIRSRLDTQGADLRQRLGKLNAERQKVFGAVDFALKATDRVTTENNCIPRDMAAVGDGDFIFAYNVQLGLRSEMKVSDVFGVYAYDRENHTFHHRGLDQLENRDFEADFRALYKYYKETHFVKFMLIGPHLYMAFRVGKEIDDIKCFKWILQDGKLTYLGNRFDHEYVFPPQQEFEWTRAHRDMHREGLHPHVAIDDRLFVETVGGDLTIKVEDNTESGAGIYSEAVTDEDQTLDDAEIFYAVVGSLILLKIRPYKEKDYRNFIYNEKTKQVLRVDSMEGSCVLLPEDHGIVFSNGYHLQTGETKIFDTEILDMRFERRIPSPNGEDCFFVFYNRPSGVYILLSYNLIRQSIDTPILCNGYSIFPNGELLYFRTEDQPQKHHVLQVWQTPYASSDAETGGDKTAYLYKVGNPAIVRCMAECQEVLNLLSKDDTYADLYVDLVKKTGDVVDSYFWVAKPEAQDLAAPLKMIHGAAQAAIDEFDKVQRLRRATADETGKVRTKAAELVSVASHTPPDDILGFVHHLAELRRVRGEIITLRDRRYVDSALVDRLEADVEEATEKVSAQTVEFLLKPESLDPYRAQVGEEEEKIQALAKVTDAEAIGELLDKTGAELEMLIDIVGNLKIEDATETTKIIDEVSTIYASLNQVRATLKNRRQALAKSEGEAQFGAQMKLLGQAVINYLDLCATPEKCDEYLTKTMVQLEELEGRYSEFEEYVLLLTEKRDEIYNAFESKKQSLLEARNKRAGSLAKSADRILNGIRNRVGGFEALNEIHGYLASDLMVDKVRDIIAQLTELGDSVKADDIQTRLKSIGEDAARQLKDRQELFVDGKDVIQFGNHRFSVNTQELELSVVPHDDEMSFHLAGTNFFEAIEDDAFLATRDVWDQEIISENRQVYRVEYLAWQILKALETKEGSGGNGSASGPGALPASTADFLALAESDQLEAIQAFMGPRYAEGYTKGVHDRDGALLLDRLLTIHADAGLLRYAPVARAVALVFWECWRGEDRERLRTQLQAFGLMRSVFKSSATQTSYIAELTDRIDAYLAEGNLYRAHGGTMPPPSILAPEAAEYLFYQLVEESAVPVVAGAEGEVAVAVSHEAAELHNHFHSAVTGKRAAQRLKEACEKLGDAEAKFEVILDWIAGYLESGGIAESAAVSGFVFEAAAHVLRGGFDQEEVIQTALEADIDGMLGSHPVVAEGRYVLHYNLFTDKLRRFEQEDVREFRSYTELKTQLVEDKRDDLRLEEFKPRVMTSFVRNRLLDQVYLPMVGDNLAKQIGTVGRDTRTDRMGLLMLVSPPGYGKTTLMEYIANRLGLTFVKVNGPAIGHGVTSLDPAEAPNASAREEVERLNLSLEMGDNVMIYLDDIQHCNPEFLQKFISLCDGQRRIEGVYRGEARTYDLRGKKVCVVMAGNPYTESGGKFRIPDMLANRADTYNLGDIIGGHAEAFRDSYIENSLTSNPVMAKLASRSQKDVYAIMRIAETGSQEGVDFEGNYSVEEIGDLTSVMLKLFRVRDTILRVNLQYIASAAQEDDYRTEPAFLLQGSYRNMNRIAEKILPLMTAEEVDAVVMDHYENESQTLTSNAEANLLKFKELEGILTDEESARWEEIKKKFNRNLLMGGGGENDPVSRVVGQLASFGEGLEKIEGAVTRAAASGEQPATLADVTVAKLEKIIAGLRAVPVDVQIKVLPVQEGGGAAPSSKPFSSAEKPAAKKKATRSKKAPAKKKSASKPPVLPVDIESEVKQDEDE